MTRPTLLIKNTLDDDSSSTMSTLFAALTAAPVKERAFLSGGTNAGCGYHLFNSLEAEYVDATAGFIDRYNATLVPLPTVLYYQGLWWSAPAESEAGWRINFAQQGDTIVATWFIHDGTDKPWWLIAVLSETASNVYSGPVSTLTVSGPPFHAMPFKPAAVVGTAIGSMTVIFADSSHASLAYTLNGIQGDVAIHRQRH